MGGLLGINNTWFKGREPINFIDINNIIDAGSYCVWGNMDLSDEERMGIVKNEEFVLEVLFNGTGCTQRITAVNSPNYIYQRVSISIEPKKWRPWMLFTVTQVGG